MRSEHQKRVEVFAKNMGMQIPDKPVQGISPDTRLLLAKLLLEELLETLERGLGVNLIAMHQLREGGEIDYNSIDFDVTPSFNMVEIVDGVCDIKFVATKLLSLCGIPDEPFQQIVDYNNIMKFSTGGKLREDGKWIKPPDHSAPEIRKLLEGLSFK